MSNLAQLIQHCIDAKQGSREFARWGMSHVWRAEIGNESSHVMLGEQDGEFRGEGTTAELAVAALLANVCAGRRAL